MIEVMDEHPLMKMPQPWAVLRKGSAPTVAHWLKRALEQANTEVVELNPRRPNPPEQLASFRTVVVIRTLPSRWLKPLRQMRTRGCRVVLLLDDDLLTPSSLRGLPWVYRWRLWWGVTRHRQHLVNWVDSLWVSTSALKRQCQAVVDLPIQVLPLQPAAEVFEVPKLFRIAYLGTTAHQQELQWLVSLFRTLQQRRNDCLLELVVNRRWRARFRGIPRMRMFYPMDWETFCQDTGNRQVDLLLVPLLEGNFNAGRAPVKVFDAMRLGAVGLYSNRKPYGGCIRDDIDGLLLTDESEDWLQAIDALLADPERRHKLLEASRRRNSFSCHSQQDNS